MFLSKPVTSALFIACAAFAGSTLAQQNFDKVEIKTEKLRTNT